jgi:P-type conjugative transfer protein TrbG
VTADFHASPNRSVAIAEPRGAARTRSYRASVIAALSIAVLATAIPVSADEQGLSARSSAAPRSTNVPVAPSTAQDSQKTATTDDARLRSAGAHRMATAVAAETTNPVKDTVARANSSARIEPAASLYVNAMQIWPFSPAALYQVYTRPGRITDIVLQAGEQLVDLSAPDTIRWIVGNTTSGEKDAERVHISIKPTSPDLTTNLVIYTNRRTYYLEVTATTATWMAAVSWEYPHDVAASIRASSDRSRAAQPSNDSTPLERLNFGYEITGARVPWKPLRCFDDGSRVYIQFPANIAQHDLPPLFLVSVEGTTQLTNYRVQPPYYIVDRLFDVAELRIGERKGSAVRIRRVIGGGAP